MNQHQKPPTFDAHDPSKRSIRQLLSDLTLTQIFALGSCVVTVISIAFQLGSQLHPTVQDVMSENKQLISALATAEIVDGRGHEVAIDTFIAKSQTQLIGLESLFPNRLFAPKVKSPWVPFFSEEIKAGGKLNSVSNDLTILAKSAELPEEAVKDVFPAMSAFNAQNPPRIWIAESGSDQVNLGQWFPYIQISVISRENAQALMRVVQEDSAMLLETGLNRMQEPFYRHLSLEQQEIFKNRLSKMFDAPTALKLLLSEGCTSMEQENIFESFGKDQLEREQRITELSNEAMELIKKHFTVPSRLFSNGMESLSEVTPESGLLLGRLLFYVFGVSGKGRVDIEQLTVNYSGSYARTRRAIRVSAVDQNPVDAYVFDHIMILATKSDFALIHVRVPHLNDHLRQLDLDTQGWFRQIRLLETR